MCTDRRVRAALALVGTVQCAACNGTTSYLDATGTAGHQEGQLGIWLTATACVVVALVTLAIVLGIVRRRDPVGQQGDDAAAMRANIPSGLRWIHVGLAATIVVLAATLAGTLVTLQAASHPPMTPAITIDVTGHQWWWEVRYSDATRPNFSFVTANEIHLPVNQPVRVRLQSADVIHSFWLPQIAGKTDVIPGQVNEMWLEARKPGRSMGLCGEYCGLQHAMMMLAVTAEAPDAFARWADARRAEAAAPSTPEQQTGRVVFTRSCGACHTVGGTNAGGRVGPDLTHFASRPMIGAGVFTNTPANLARWIHDPPSVKEGARMPAIPLDSAEITAVVAYLESLR